MVHGCCHWLVDRFQRLKQGMQSVQQHSINHMVDEITSENKDAKVKDDQAAALVVAQAFIVFSAIYWFTQIELRELLQLAYG